MSLEQKKQETFEKLLYEASLLARSAEERGGLDRETADKFMEAVLAAPSVWTKYRFSCFWSFLQIVEDDATTKNDIKLLKNQFLKNKENRHSTERWRQPLLDALGCSKTITSMILRCTFEWVWRLSRVRLQKTMNE